MKVAAYQIPLLGCGSMAAIELIRKQVKWCESEGVAILCCPEAILGGLADYAPQPADFAIDVEGGQLASVLAPLASSAVTTILGFTEIAGGNRLYNAAAVFHNGKVAGLYRKLHPAIHKSVYAAGDRIPVFTVSGLTFGIIICNDSNFFEPARIMIGKGATTLFVPTNNGLPANRAQTELVSQARNVDIARAIDSSVSVIRADVSGRTDDLVSYGSSAIIDSDGRVLQSAPPLTEKLLVADIKTGTRR
ncbi:MAG: carbon-nitrogen hydrolase family protein [Bryobacteraceae bacterium]